ncbi:MAG: branched-chain amino acid ABC transporter permease [Casimicrobiaceae bacterium]|nr:branched-chain amino acid ABC transporter permease [Casimicrobiaceae bacterium]MCX8099346.1 branched-chain amino acid ABC transporter permease [Casimicrobiaceae bacterium]MDW8311232.1 branched-chain amino acid ABC transporter permease [Burkholderiales bacterium]
MEVLLQQIVNGLVVGSVYALVALGYTMVYGILQLINFAHGDIVMIGALTALFTASALVAAGAPAWVALLGSILAAMVVCSLVGVTVERLAYRPLRHAPRLAPLITAIGVSILLQQIAILVFGRNYFSFPELIPKTPMSVGPVTITPNEILIFLTSLALMSGLLWLVHRTKIGTAMRATAENPKIAGLMGIDINRVIAFTFAIGSALGAIAGVMVASNYGQAHYFMGFMLGLKAFTAAVMGGIGNLWGAMIGGLLLGLVENVGLIFVRGDYKDIFAFIVLVLVLIFRPQGLVGERVAERA